LVAASDSSVPLGHLVLLMGLNWIENLVRVPQNFIFQQEVHFRI
jgi:hypothetical protein